MWIKCPPCLRNVDMGHYVVDKDQAKVEVDAILKDLDINKDELYEAPATKVFHKNKETFDILSQEGTIQK